MEARGVCHSDALVKDGGSYPVAYPRIPGHEVIGLIDAVGTGVHPWTVGQRVGVGWHGGHDFVCTAAAAYERMLSNRVRFRAVLLPQLA